MARKKKIDPAPSLKSILLSDSAIRLIVNAQQEIVEAQQRYGNVLITLAAGAGIPEGSSVQGVDLDTRSMSYLPPTKPPLEIVKDGPDA